MKYWTRTSSFRPSVLRSIAVTSSLAATCLMWPCLAHAQSRACDDTEENRKSYVQGEKASRIQIEQVWKTLNEDCSKVPEINAFFVKRVVALIKGMNLEAETPGLVCRFSGRINGIFLARDWLEDICSSQTPSDPEPAHSSEPVTAPRSGSARFPQLYCQ